MIHSKDAYHNVILHQTRKPIMHLTTVSDMIKTASLLGYESIDISIHINSERKIREKLKQQGYLLEVLYVKTLPNEIFLRIKWVTSEFIGDTIKEIDGD